MPAINSYIRIANSTLVSTCLLMGAAVVVLAFPNIGVAQRGNTLAYVDSSADIVLSTRPAMIMRSDDFKDLRRTGGKHIDKIANRVTDSYFKFSLAEIQEIDQIILATSTPEPRSENSSGERYNVIVLKTVKDNTTGFDMVTQNVTETIEFNGVEYFAFKKPLNYVYRYAHIADSKTIVWTASRRGMELSIAAGSDGPKSAAWYQLWQEFSDKPISIAVKATPQMTYLFPPQLSALKKVQIIAGGVDIARQSKVKVKAVCAQESDAKEVVVAFEEAIEMGRKQLESQKKAMKRTGQDAQYKLAMDLIKATKIKSVGKTVELESVIKIDLDKLVSTLEASYLAAKRTEAGNNLRAVMISFHNFHDATGGFPSPVMVHESGKKYSWRIAVLPYIEQQEIYDRYDFTEEWDSPHNREVTSQMPDVFRSDSDDKDSTNTSWFMLDGEDGIANGENARDLTAISNGDGTSNTILGVEAKRNVHWAKPEDIAVDPKRSFPKLGGFHKGGFNVAFADGSVQFIDDKVDPDVLWKLYTAAGGEVMDKSKLDAPDK